MVKLQWLFLFFSILLFSSLPPAIAQSQDRSSLEINISDLSPGKRGVLVINVNPGGPAHQAGIQSQDIITHMNNQETENTARLLQILGNTKPRMVIPVVLVRNGHQKTLVVKLGSLSDLVKQRRKDAEAGNADAQLRLGQWYMSGYGVPRDEKMGVAWVRQSAGQGNTEAQKMLSEMSLSNKQNRNDGNQRTKEEPTILSGFPYAWQSDDGEIIGTQSDVNPDPSIYRKLERRVGARGNPKTRKSTSNQRQGNNFQHFKEFKVIDRQTFNRPIEVARFMAPKDWVLSGGVQWNTKVSCIRDLIKVNVRVIHPKDLIGFEIFPKHEMFWMNSNSPMDRMAAEQTGCSIIAPLGLTEYMEKVFLPAFRSRGQIQDIQPDPEGKNKLARILQEKVIPEENRAMRNANQPPARLHSYDVGRVRVKFVYPNYTVQEWFFISNYALTNPKLTYGVASIHSVWAPEGQLEKYESLFNTIRASLRVNPAWVKGKTDLIQQLHNARLQAAQVLYAQNERFLNQARQQAAHRANLNQNSQIPKDKWRDDLFNRKMKSLREGDETFSKSLNSIREVQPYVNPETGIYVEVPNTWDSAWQNGNGELAGTNHGINPNSDPRFGGPGWTQLNKK